jgi:hypothetical protein
MTPDIPNSPAQPSHRSCEERLARDMMTEYRFRQSEN